VTMHGLGLHRVRWHKYVAYERRGRGRMRSWSM